MSASHILFTASSELTEQGGTEIALDQPPPSSQIASFDWDSLVEPRLRFDAPFQITRSLVVLLMNEPQLVSCLLVLGEGWDLLALCRLLVSY